jgi:CO/xanthine dehydrogenase Mo-binding subunit
VADRKSPLKGLKPEAVTAANGKLVARDDQTRGEWFADLLTRAGKKTLSGEGEAKKKFSMQAFGAVFAEVGVDPDYGTVRVRRVSAAYAAGRILNAKTARSQFLGGITFGIGTALLEQTVTDHRTGRIVTHDLEGYMVPVNADVPASDVAIVPEDDPHTTGRRGSARSATSDRRRRWRTRCSTPPASGCGTFPLWLSGCCDWLARQPRLILLPQPWQSALVSPRPFGQDGD